MVREVMFILVKILTPMLNMPSTGCCWPLSWEWNFQFSQWLTLDLQCLTRLFPASLMILGEILFFVVWIPSNPEIAYNWKKQTSLPREHLERPWGFLFSLWPWCFCICLLRFSSHLCFFCLRPSLEVLCAFHHFKPTNPNIPFSSSLLSPHVF